RGRPCAPLGPAPGRGDSRPGRLSAVTQRPRPGPATPGPPAPSRLRRPLTPGRQVGPAIRTRASGRPSPARCGGRAPGGRSGLMAGLQVLDREQPSARHLPCGTTENDPDNLQIGNARGVAKDSHEIGYLNGGPVSRETVFRKRKACTLYAASLMIPVMPSL